MSSLVAHVFQYHAASPRLVLLSAGLFLLGLRSSPGGQGEERGAAGRARAETESKNAELSLAGSVPAAFVGRVVDLDGRPRAGAVVVTSAGGRAVTDERGDFRLEVEVPLDAESVQVTARASDGRVSAIVHARVAVAASGPTQAGVLRLQPGGCCEPGWVPTFGERPGVDGTVYGLTSFDDGGGAALYACGGFVTAGGTAANRVVRWDGSGWSPLGSGMGSRVLALTSFDDGDGPELYAGGFFTSAGGVPANRVARWNGASWSALGGGLDSTVRVLAVFDDGGGPALYAGGDFTSAGGAAASRIAKWNGTSWSALGSGLDGVVRALAVFDDGGGPALYVGGDFTNAGGGPASRIAKWDGTSWSALGSGLSAAVGNAVHALATYDSGSGELLYAAGYFTTAGGVAANNIARWDGSTWQQLGSGLGYLANALQVFGDGGGPLLYAAGLFTTAGGVQVLHVAKWDGSSWSALNGGLYPGQPFALTVFDDGSGPALFAGGEFSATNGSGFDHIARYDGLAWSALGHGLDDTTVLALAGFDDGGGPVLYAGGDFRNPDGRNYIARWDGTGWSPLGSGMNHEVSALAVFDDGGGSALYAGGNFSSVNGQPVAKIARWNGSSWSTLGGIGSTNSWVSALAVFDDGGGPALYVGGLFSSAGGVAASNIARWNGASWSALGSGTNERINALAVFDDGGGPALYAGGVFTTAGGVTVNRVAEWNGSSWSGLGCGVNSTVDALAPFEAGSGPALYVGGSFTNAGCAAASCVAAWDGTAWSALNGGTSGPVRALRAFDDGSGLALWAGGSFVTAGGVAANSIARWDGSDWSPLGGGMNGPVEALAVFDDGSSPALFAGGSFSVALDSRDAFMAKWGCSDTLPPELSCPSAVLVADDRGGAPGEVVHFSVTASDACDVAPDVVCVPPSGSFFPRGTTIVTCTATDAAGNQATCDFPVVVALPPPVRVR